VTGHGPNYCYQIHREEGTLAKLMEGEEGKKCVVRVWWSRSGFPLSTHHLFTDSAHTHSQIHTVTPERDKEFEEKGGREHWVR